MGFLWRQWKKYTEHAAEMMAELELVLEGLGIDEDRTAIDFQFDQTKITIQVSWFEDQHECARCMVIANGPGDYYYAIEHGRRNMSVRAPGAKELIPRAQSTFSAFTTPAPSEPAKTAPLPPSAATSPDRSVHEFKPLDDDPVVQAIAHYFSSRGQAMPSGSIVFTPAPPKAGK